MSATKTKALTPTTSAVRFVDDFTDDALFLCGLPRMPSGSIEREVVANCIIPGPGTALFSSPASLHK